MLLNDCNNPFAHKTLHAYLLLEHMPHTRLKNEIISTNKEKDRRIYCIPSSKGIAVLITWMILTYIYKGPDKDQAVFKNDIIGNEAVDEINEYMPAIFQKLKEFGIFFHSLCILKIRPFNALKHILKTKIHI